MLIMLKSKIHRALVTDANINYEGSIAIDPVLMEAAGILPYEQVHVLDLENGSRLETYTIPGARGSGEVCINGAAARLVQKGDKVIIIAYALVDEREAPKVKPRLVYVNQSNAIVEVKGA